MDQISWFIELYEAHFGKTFPRTSRDYLYAALSALQDAVGSGGESVLVYVLTRRWDKTDPRAIVSLVSDIYTTINHYGELISDLWKTVQYPGGVRGMDLKVRAFGELIIQIMAGMTTTHDDALSFLLGLSGGL